MLRNLRNTIAFCTLVGALLINAAAAGAKPVQPKLTSVKASGTKVTVAGTVKLPAKKSLHGKKLKIKVTLKPASGKSVTKSSSIKAKRKAATVKFKVSVTAGANGVFKASAQVYAGKKKFGKASKSKSVTVTGYPGGNPSGTGTAVSVGGAASCALVGDLKCWGSGIAVGNNSADGSATAVPVLTGLAGTGFRFSVGEGGTCFLMNGGFKCLGSGYYGQLGNGTSGLGAESGTPVQVQGLTSGGVAISGGGGHACAIANAKIYCWGRNDYGQLGNNSSGGAATTPEEVVMTGMGTPYSVAAGGLTTCANTSNGIWCWGLSQVGQIGNGGTMDLTPHKVPEHVQGALAGATNFPDAYLDVGNDHVCAELGGQAYCWGSNQYGQLGKPLSTTTSNVPVSPDGLPIVGVMQIDAGYYFSCAIVLGTAKCWGINNQGQTGTGSIGSPVTAPTTVVGFESGATSVSGGNNGACGSRGAPVFCWGSAGGGKALGNGQMSDTGTPVAVQGL